MSPVIVIYVKTRKGPDGNAPQNIIRANHNLGWVVPAVCYPIEKVSKEQMTFLVEGRTTYKASSIHPSHPSCNAHNVKPAIWWNIVSQCYAWCVYTVQENKLWTFIPSFGLWMPSNQRNSRERRARRALNASKCMDRAICCSRSINVTNDLSLRASSSIGRRQHAKPIKHNKKQN